MAKDITARILLPVLLATVYYLTIQEGTTAPTDNNFLLKCENGRSIPKRLRCNEVDDCDDGSDEKGCFLSSCGKDQKKCDKGGKCIPSSYWCDGEKDCRDGSDEHICPCHKDQFQCGDKACIKKIFKCDSIDDCYDKSDETNCDQCSDISFTCTNSTKFQCVTQSKFCDGTPNCDDKTDEMDCKELACGPNQFHCEHGACIHEASRCNKIKDCKDWSDEAKCDECSPKLFTCNSGECVDRQAVCNSSVECPDRSDEDYCNGGAPHYWLGTSFRRSSINTRTDLEQRDEFLNNENVVVYFDNGVRISNTTEAFLPLGKAWQYVRETFGQFGPDPRLYLILYNRDNSTSLRTTTTTTTPPPIPAPTPAATPTTTPPPANSPRCFTRTFMETTATNERNIIECTNMGSNDWDLRNNFTDIYNLYKHLGELVLKVLNVSLVEDLLEKHQAPNFLTDLLFYDIYLYLHGPTESIVGWKDTSLIDDFTPVTSFFFYKIYEMHGGASFVSNFDILSKVYNVTESRTTDGCRIHFLNGAAGVDLTQPVLSLRNLTRDANLRFHNEFAQCKLKYPNFIYAANDTVSAYIPPRNWQKNWRGHSDQLTLVYADENVAFYFKNFKIYSITNFGKISLVWKYMKRTYGPFGSHSNSYINIVLHDKVSAGNKCTSSNDNAYIDTEFDSRHVIDCGPTVHSKWGVAKAGYLDEIVVEMAKMALKLTRETGNWPAKRVSGWTMASIIVYDIYKELFETETADKWKHAKSTEFENGDGIHWFKDWYLERYERVNGSHVLNEFFNLLNSKWPKNGNNFKEQMNIGEFVHFWSGASGKSVQGLAKLRLSWTPEFQSQFVNARDYYPGLPYSCESDLECKSDTMMVYIVSGVASAIILCILVGFGLKFAIYRKRLDRMSNYIRNLTKDEINEFYQGNPNLVQVGKDTHATIQALPFNANYEIKPKDRLVIDDSRVLGSGEFGVVKEGVLKGDPKSGTADLTVAVKTVKKSVEVSYFKAMLSEIKIMAHIGAHENIAALLGTVTENVIKNREVYVAIEFCAKGDLRQYLQGGKDKFVDLFGDSKKYVKAKEANVALPPSKSSSSVKRTHPLTTMDLVDWSIQIACGMSYLSTKEVIHGDLAARNVLVTADNIAKVSDFGLSRQLVHYSNYQKKPQEVPLPWRWLALESLTDMAFSAHSDVWAYGVTIWEIFSLGKIPYAGRTWDHEFVDELTAGIRLPAPEFASREIYGIMLDCMKKEPEERISFEYVTKKLEKIKASIDVPAKPGVSPEVEAKQPETPVPGPAVPAEKPTGPPVPPGKPTGPPVPTGKPTGPPVPAGKPAGPPVPSKKPTGPPVPLASNKPIGPPVAANKPTGPLKTPTEPASISLFEFPKLKPVGPPVPTKPKDL